MHAVSAAEGKLARGCRCGRWRGSIQSIFPRSSSRALLSLPSSPAAPLSFLFLSLPSPSFLLFSCPFLSPFHPSHLSPPPLLFIFFFLSLPFPPFLFFSPPFFLFLSLPLPSFLLSSSIAPEGSNITNTAFSIDVKCSNVFLFLDLFLISFSIFPPPLSLLFYPFLCPAKTGHSTPVIPSHLQHL